MTEAEREAIRTRLLVVKRELEAAQALSFSAVIAQVLGTVTRQLKEIEE